MKSELLTLGGARSPGVASDELAALVGWLESYPVASHALQGRRGPVCPFTEQAIKFDTLRMSLCYAGSDEEERVFAAIRRSFVALSKIPAAPGRKHLRAVLVGFPNCGSPEGIAMLQRVDKRHKYYALVRLRTIGFMHPWSEASGVWNAAFRPMRAPMPVMIVRVVVEQDAPFIAHHRLSLAPYLLRYGFAGARRLRAYRQRLARLMARAGA